MLTLAPAEDARERVFKEVVKPSGAGEIDGLPPHPVCLLVHTDEAIKARFGKVILARRT